MKLKQALNDATRIALENNAEVRVFDVRYATQGIPDEIGDEYVRFPAGSVEVLETGLLSEPPTSCVELVFPRWIPYSAILEIEVAKKYQEMAFYGIKASSVL